MPLNSEDLLQYFGAYLQGTLSLSMSIKGLYAKKNSTMGGAGAGKPFDQKLPQMNWNILVSEENRLKFSQFCERAVEAKAITKEELSPALLNPEPLAIIEGIVVRRVVLDYQICSEADLAKFSNISQSSLERSYELLQAMLRQRLISSDDLISLKVQVQKKTKEGLETDPAGFLSKKKFEIEWMNTESHTLDGGGEGKAVVSTSKIAPPNQTKAKQQTIDDIPKQFGPYEVLEEIARGGMGVVYKVRHNKLNHLYALKVMIAGENASQTAIERFHREARAVAKLRHPGIIQVHEFGENAGIHYFSMDYVEGIPLNQYVLQKSSPVREVVRLIRDTAQILDYAHMQGVLHRDLKPENILVDTTGQPRILDFGLAIEINQDEQRLTQEGVTMGTPAYMSPEQALGKIKEIDCTSDVYSLGACFYEIITRKSVFPAKTFHEMFYKVTSDEEPVSPHEHVPGLHQDLNTIILTCLNKEREKRYQSAKALEEDLTNFLNGLPIKARPATRKEIYLRWIRRNKMAAILGLVVFLFCLGFACYLMFSIWQTRQKIRNWIQDAEQELAKKDFAEATTKIGSILSLDDDNATALILREKVREQKEKQEIEDIQQRKYEEALNDLTESRRLKKEYRTRLENAQKEAEEARLAMSRLSGWESWATQSISFTKQLESQKAWKERVKYYLHCENLIEKGIRLATEAGDIAKETLKQLIELDVELQFEEWAEAHRIEDDTKAAFHLEKYAKRIQEVPHLERYYSRKFLGDGVLQIEDSSPSGAQVWIFRYIEENKITEIPLDPDTPAGVIELFKQRGGLRRIPLPFNLKERTCRIPSAYYEMVENFWEFDKDKPRQQNPEAQLIQTTGGSLTPEEYKERLQGSGYPLFFESDDYNLLGNTPLKFEAFPNGSYLLIYRFPKEKQKNFAGQTFEYQETRVPLFVPREGKVYLQSVPCYLTCEIPEGMVYVPDIPFISGGDPKAHDSATLNTHKRLPPFFVSRFECSFRDYCDFLEHPEVLKEIQKNTSRENFAFLPRTSSGYLYGITPERLQLPEIPEEELSNPLLESVRGISQQDALAYVEWRNRKATQQAKQLQQELEQKKKLSNDWRKRYPFVVLKRSDQALQEFHPEAIIVRLHRFGEWEKCVRGTDGRYYAWGNEMYWKYVCGGSTHSGERRIDPQGWYPYDESPWGIRDLSGGTYEWGQDSTLDDEEGKKRCIPGGAFNDSYTTSYRGAANDAFDPADADVNYGFRLYSDILENH